MTKYIYAFDEGQKSMRDVLGGKGANLSEMKRLGLPVPDLSLIHISEPTRPY